MSKFKIVTRKIKFSDCGLDAENNILQAPICECGCGNYMSLVIEDEETLHEFIADMLSMQECEHCAIYVLHNDGKTVTIGDSDGEHISLIKFCDKENDTLNVDLVRDWQDEFEFHCYGLLEQLENGQSYRIVME